MAKDYELRVALWQIPTGVSTDLLSSLVSNAVGNLTHERRCDFLEEAVRDASAHFGGPTPGATPINIFVVPEYYFANSADLHFVDEYTKNQTVERLKAISRIGNTVLVPGTVAWLKPFKRPGHWTNVFRTSRYKRAKKRTRDTRNLFSPNQRGESGTVTRLKKAKREEALNRSFYAQNTAWVLRGGSTLVKYHKRMNGSEINEKDIPEGFEFFWIPGPRTGEFKVGNLNCGVEICAEHGGKAMQKASGTVLDVHIVIAASMNLQLDHSHVRNGGYVLYCDSNFLPSVHRKTDGLFEEIGPGTEKLKAVFDMDEMADRLISVREEAIRRGKSSEDVDRFTYDVALTRMSGRLHYYSLPIRR